jgi:hypothetical protein
VASFGDPSAPASELNISVSAPPFSPYAPAPAVATGGGPRTATSLSHSAPAKVLPPVPRKVLPVPPAAAQSPPTFAVDAPRRPSTEESTSNNDGGGGSADNLDGEDAPLRPPRPARPIQKYAFNTSPALSALNGVADRLVSRACVCVGAGLACPTS